MADDEGLLTLTMRSYREALSIVRSWLNNPNKGVIPRTRTLRLWPSPDLSYRVKANSIESWEAIDSILSVGTGVRPIRGRQRRLNGPHRKVKGVTERSKVALLILSYRKLVFWIDWQCKKLGALTVLMSP